MDRRLFLKLTGFAAVAASTASAFDVLPASAERLPTFSPAEEAAAIVPAAVASGATDLRQMIQQPGEYQLTGLVRLESPLVEITGRTLSQQISWSDAGADEAPVVSFTAFERFDTPGLTQQIQVSGGTLQSLSVVPVHLF